MSKHEKMRVRFTWADRLLLLGLVALLVSGAWFWGQRKNAAQSNVTIEYTICVENANERLQAQSPQSLIAEGAVVKSANGTAVLGNVTEINTIPHLEATVRGGTLVFLNLRDRYDLYITVVGMAVQKAGDGTRIQDIRIAAGERGDFHIGGIYAAGAQIVSVAEATV